MKDPVDKYRPLVEDTQFKADRIKELYNSFTPEQLEKYEIFKRSKFNRSVIRTILEEQTINITNNMVPTLIGAMAKIYVGEIMEKALELHNENSNDKNQPIHSKDILTTIRKYEDENPRLYEQKYATDRYVFF